MSPLRMVEKAEGKAASTEDRTLLPLRYSSLMRSKYTMYESEVIPIDTTTPVTPASVSVVPLSLAEQDDRSDEE